MSAFPLLYVAGPYRASTPERVDLNIQSARQVGALAASKGYAVIVPHANTAQMERLAPHLSDDYWLAATLAIMKTCDAVVLAPGWSKSAGTLAEISEARAMGIAVFESVDTMPEASDFWRR